MRKARESNLILVSDLVTSVKELADLEARLIQRTHTILIPALSNVQTALGASKISNKCSSDFYARKIGACTSSSRIRRITMKITLQ